ncbi:hypothetical protein BGW80DRAFT_1227660 [Lactifluus volemus]|nr:hypothetical protein BGW80DRAFT_1236058 [Lactifluus volemus]KAH9972297.1 hypothetical protein BGW80DRAFT_1227660 [Lactifluus volemus]
MDFATDNAAYYEPHSGSSDRDPIATLRTLIRVIRASSIRRQYFSRVLKTLEQDDLQLLRDMDVRWSSTLLMIERALILRTAVDKFLALRDMEELRKYRLSVSDWDMLEVFRKVLSIPHAFQQRLSGESTPTLCDAIPAFEAMKIKWQIQKDKIPSVSRIIDKGLDKLEEYRARAEMVPAYILAMGEDTSISILSYR